MQSMNYEKQYCGECSTCIVYNFISIFSVNIYMHDLLSLVKVINWDVQEF